MLELLEHEPTSAAAARRADPPLLQGSFTGSKPVQIPQPEPTASPIRQSARPGDVMLSPSPLPEQATGADQSGFPIGCAPRLFVAAESGDEAGAIYPVCVWFNQRRVGRLYQLDRSPSMPRPGSSGVLQHPETAPLPSLLEHVPARLRIGLIDYGMASCTRGGGDRAAGGGAVPVVSGQRPVLRCLDSCWVGAFDRPGLPAGAGLVEPISAWSAVAAPCLGIAGPATVV